MNKIVLSVIIPTFNAAKTIEQAVQSVLQQTYPNIELLVIDGASTDNTVSILKSLNTNQNFTIVSEKDKGVYDAMNKGIHLAKGEWLYFLGADDNLLNDNIINEILTEKDLNEYDVLYGDILLKTSKTVYGGRFTTSRLLLENIPHQGMFYRKNMFDKFGNYDLKYKILADYVFNLSWFGNKGIKRKYIDKTVAEYAEEGMSTVKRDIVYKKDRTSIVRKYYSFFWFLYATFFTPVLNLLNKKIIGKK